MKKREFMEELKEALEGNVSPQTFYDTINYYDDYFRKEKEAGRSEEEICRRLGSARIIAKTIIDTESQKNGNYHYDDSDTYYGEKYSGDESYYEEEKSKKGWHINIDENGRPSVCYGRLDFGSTLGKVLIAIAGVIVLALVFSVFAGIFWLGIKIVWYIVIPVVIILFIVNLIMYLFFGGR